MSTRSTWILGILWISGLFLAGATAPAAAQGSFGISGGIYQPEEEGDSDLDTTEVFGVRGGYRFRPNLGFEASLSRVDLADAIPQEESSPGFDFDFEFDVTNLDLSLQWFPGGGNFLVFGGPGFARIDGEVSLTVFGERFSGSDTADVLTAHAGLGYEWQITDRFFIRPEARVRRYFDDEDSIPDDEEIIFVAYEATDYEASVVFGWRFGS
jgi:hypothetical protein